MDYISVADVAQKWGISCKRVQVLCKAGRIEGAKQISRVWLIPCNAEKPRDQRVKSDKYW